MTSAYNKICHVRCTHVAVVVVVNSLTLTHCQGLDLGYTSVAVFRYRLICGSLIIARFSAKVMGVGLSVGQLIREYIQQTLHRFITSGLRLCSELQKWFYLHMIMHTFFSILLGQAI